MDGLSQNQPGAAHFTLKLAQNPSRTRHRTPQRAAHSRENNMGVLSRSPARTIEASLIFDRLAAPAAQDRRARSRTHSARPMSCNGPGARLPLGVTRRRPAHPASATGQL